MKQNHTVDVATQALFMHKVLRLAQVAMPLHASVKAIVL